MAVKAAGFPSLKFPGKKNSLLGTVSYQKQPFANP
jgi:hypothetical protein